jgi:hypothetical protein
MKKYSLVLCIIFIFIGGCTKEDTIVIENKTGLLVDKKWQLTGLTIKSSAGVFSDEYDSLPAYRKDDYFIFKRDSTYEFNDHIDTMPGKHSKILDAGIWKFNNRQTHVEMQSDVFNTTYNPARLIELSTNKLLLERTHPGDGSVTTTTYKPF